MGTVVDIKRLRGREQPKPVLSESDAERATASDYVLFFGISAISCALMALGLVKLIDSL